MFCHNNKAFLFLLVKKMQPRRLRLSALANKKIGSGSTLKVAAPAPQHCLVGWVNCSVADPHLLLCGSGIQKLSIWILIRNFGG